MARMKIFNSLEEDTFENPPSFSSVERKKFFDFPATILDVVATFKTPTNKVCFLLMFAYFKARKKFFFRKFNSIDVSWVVEKLKFSITQIDIDSYARETYSRHQTIILEFFGFKEFDQQSEDLIRSYISLMAKSQIKPKQILLETVSLLAREKIEIPSYNQFIQSEKEEQEIAEACRRPIKNAVICWNYLYLSKKLKEEKSIPKKIEMIKSIKNGSVVTWRHINLHGEYDFSEEKLQDSVDLLTSQNFDLNLNVILGA